jgi:Tol biopolymer transport system component
MEIPAEGGAPHPVLSSADSKWQIIKLQYSPEGKWFVFQTWDMHILLLPTSGGTPQEILQGTSPAWDPSSKRLYYAKPEPSGGTRIESVKFDESSGNILGPPQSLGVMTGVLRDLVLSRDGKQLVVTERQESLNLTLLPLTSGGAAPAGTEQQLNAGDVDDHYPTFSPDGAKIAFTDTRLGFGETWILDLKSRKREQVTLPQSGVGRNFPFWSPDGRRLAITQFQPDNNNSLWVAYLDGSGSEEVVRPKPGLRGASFSPDGLNLLYAYRKDGFFQVFAMDLASRHERQLTFSPSDKYDPVWSVDGQWTAYSSSLGGPCCQIWRTAVSGDEGEQPLTHGYDRLRHLSYSRDGRWLYFQPNHLNIYRMAASGGKPEQVTNFPESGLFIEEPSLSPDGRSLVYSRNNGGSSLWLLELGGGGKMIR